MDYSKFFLQLLVNNKNIKFSEFTNLISKFGFYFVRQNGSHHIYKHISIKEFINIQNCKGEVKPYQIKQFLSLVEKYSLELTNE